MFKIICVTDRESCCEDFLTRIEKIAMAKPDRIIFRDKKSDIEDYIEIAINVMEISENYGVPCSVYSQSDFTGDFHIPMPILQCMSLDDVNKNKFIGTSVHSVKEAEIAEKKGVDYIIAGHIFETDCKKNLAPRGLDFLREVCKSVEIPVYAIGGINPQNISETQKAGADGACIMSGFMKCGNPIEYIKQLRGNVE